MNERIISRQEASEWLLYAGVALGERERYWFGSLLDLGQDLAAAVRRGGPEELARLARTMGGEGGPLRRRFCLFARRLARLVELTEIERIQSELATMHYPDGTPVLGRG